MFKPPAFFIGFRYVLAKQRNAFVSLISIITTTGLVLGVATLIVVLSVVNGFDRELQNRILNLVPHANIYGYQGPIQDWQNISKLTEENSQVIGSAPFIQGQGMLRHKNNVSVVAINAILPEKEQALSDIEQYIIKGTINDLNPSSNNILLGSTLAEDLDLKLGDNLSLILPQPRTNGVGITAQFIPAKLVGIIKTDSQLDASLTLVHLNTGARWFNLGTSVHGIKLKFTNLFEAPTLVRDIALKLPGIYYVNDWSYSHGNMFQHIQSSKTLIGLLLLLIVAVAAFNIVSTLVIGVTNKQADIAILRTIGLSPNSIRGIFMIQGALIGMTGTLIGIGLGVLVSLTVTDLIVAVENFFNIKLISSANYPVSFLPSELRIEDVLTVAVSAFLVSFLATLYPSSRAANVKPAEVLRHEV